MRPSGRAPDQLRKISLEPGFSRHAEGSCLVKFGDTHVLCTASVDERVPPWMRNTGRGWVTAEYGMLPRSTHTRTDREAARGKQSGRTQEIQRLIGRSLRAVVNLAGDGRAADQHRLRRAAGRRRHAHRRITGAWVALHFAFERLIKEGKLTANPITGQVAAVSCGLWQGTAVLDLDYRRGFQGRGRRQLRADRHRRHRRGAGHGREGAVQRAAVHRADGARQEGRRSSSRACSGWRSANASCVMPRRFAAPKLVVATHNRGKAERDPHACCRRSASRSSRSADLGLPAPPGDRHDLREQRHASRRWPPRAPAGCRRWPTIPA